MSKSIRLLLRGVQGLYSVNHNWPGVIKSRMAIVHITAGEAHNTGSLPAEGKAPNGTSIMQDWEYKLDNRTMIWVSNISPHDDFGGGGGVEFFVHVDSPWPRDVGVTITVEDEALSQIDNY